MRGERASRGEVVEILRGYFSLKDEVTMAFLFGSRARDQQGADSDVDIAIYFRSQEKGVEWENSSFRHPSEDAIWADLERLLGRDVDLLVLNRATPSVADSALRGVPLVVKDRGTHVDFMLRITSEAADFREWLEGYWALKGRMRDASGS